MSGGKHQFQIKQPWVESSNASRKVLIETMARQLLIYRKIHIPELIVSVFEKCFLDSTLVTIIVGRSRLWRENNQDLIMEVMNCFFPQHTCRRIAAIAQETAYKHQKAAPPNFGRWFLATRRKLQNLWKETINSSLLETGCRRSF